MPEIVSICVPIYNTGKYLRRCVDSLVSQTYQSLEIILVDDGSTDGCGAICDEYAKLDSRIRVIHKENGGEASARNVGLKAATGTYIMFCDSDDEYLPEAAELLVGAMAHENIDLSVGGYLENHQGKIVHYATGHLRQYSANEAAHSLLASSCRYGEGYILSTVNSKLFRLNIITDNCVMFDERYVVGNDTIFMCDYIKHMKAVYDIFSPAYVYYKFHGADRVQGMTWFCPDSYMLSAYVAEALLKLVRVGDDELENLIMDRYLAVINSLLKAAPYEHMIGSETLISHLKHLLTEMSFIHKGARLVLKRPFKRRVILSQNLPNRKLLWLGTIGCWLISILIMTGKIGLLQRALGISGKLLNRSSERKEYVRLMIR